jgi:hypothetical protein
MVNEGWNIVVGGECGAPEGEKLVDITMQGMGFGVEEFGSLKSCARCKGSPVVI